MIKKGKDWDSIPAYGQGGFQNLPKGGYVCRLIMAEETTSESGKPLLHIGFDIVEGEYQNYFMDLYNARKSRSDGSKPIKYPFEGQAWIPVYDYQDETKHSSKLKGFCTALEDSGNDIWTPQGELNLNAVKQSEVGVVFQNQEREYNGKCSWRAIPWGFRSVDTIRSGDFFVPDDKPLADKETYPSATDLDLPESFAASQDKIPF